jgi:two-component system, NarL family, nitrate/nitrite response regulator NarL
MNASQLMGTTHPIRILIVDDHTLFRRGLTALLSREPDFQITGDAADAGEALRRAEALQPDLILLDNHLPGVNGVDTLPALREAAPMARILMLTVSEDETDLGTALRNGANGYLLKNMEGEALANAIRRAFAGEYVMAPEMTGKLVSAYQNATTPTPLVPVTPISPIPSITPLSTLSPRELDILRCVAAGDSNKEIGRKLSIAETTVKIHVQHILRKLDVSSRVHAAVLASTHGLI